MATSLILERYEYVTRLGSGGSSTVLLAQDTQLGRRVALKRMHAADDVTARLRLRREALIGASMSHPNLVSIYDIVTTEDGEDVIVMEYVEGETLAEKLRRGENRDVPETLALLDGLAAALDAIHARGIIHRDVKPANVLLGADGLVKLADLGIAAVPDGTQITSEEAVVGTFRYMAPEQLEGADATPAIDVYALSAVAYEVLSGEKARDETNPLALAHAIATEPPPDLRVAWPEAPAEAAEVLIRGMSRDPKLRPRSAGELAARLRAAFEPHVTAAMAAAPAVAAVAAPIAAPAPAEPASPRRPPIRRTPVASPPERRRSRAPLLALLMVLLAGVVAAVVILANQGGSSERLASGTSAAATTHHAHNSTTHHAHKSTSPPRSSAGTQQQTQSASAPPAAAPAAGSSTASSSAGSPAAAVESFYHLAASHQYPSAWALADPAFRQQLDGYQGLQSTMAQERAIIFKYASVVSQSASDATVALRTTSLRTDGTQHCSGTVNLIRTGASSAGWMLDRIDIHCV